MLTIFFLCLQNLFLVCLYADFKTEFMVTKYFFTAWVDVYIYLSSKIFSTDSKLTKSNILRIDASSRNQYLNQNNLEKDVSGRLASI